MPDPNAAQRPSELPQAKVRTSRLRYWVWLVPIGVAGLVGYYLYDYFAAHGPTITIVFDEAKGLTANQSDLRYRGAKLGSVKSMELSKDRRHMFVKVELDKSAESIAVEGSEFWIVRPEVSTSGIRGLKTIVSGEYLQVKPGHGKRTDHFTGLEEPPILTDDQQGVQLTLVTDKISSLGRGSPIYYHDIQVGQVLHYELAQDGQNMHVQIFIHKKYAHLLGTNSKFWKAGGLNVRMSLAGIQMSAETIQSLIQGGVAFSTPGGVKEPVKPGAVFRLHESSLPEWTENVSTNHANSRVLIRFQNNTGLYPGQSDVMFRGVKIGEVREVTLSGDGQKVMVVADLGAFTELFAREGSIYWIVSPHISAGSVRGLQTLGSGNYIQVRPGNGKPSHDFTGSEEPPVIQVPEPGLNLVLLAEKSGSVEPGSPVYYRGIKVGEVLGSRLGPESQTVQITLHIQEHYAALVRKNSKFWNAGGINFDLSLLGAEVSAKSFQTLLSGGLAFATPNELEAPATEGMAFRLYDKPEDLWLGWAPAIPLSEFTPTGGVK